MNTINNCLELIEKEEKNMVSSISSLSSKIGSTSTHNLKKSINSKENINIFNIDKEKDKENHNNNQHNNNRNIIISKSFINKIPKIITNNNILLNSINNNNNNKNNHLKNKKINIIQLDSKNKI